MRQYYDDDPTWDWARDEQYTEQADEGHDDPVAVARLSVEQPSALAADAGEEV